MQSNATHQLHVKGPQAQNTLRRLAHESKSLGQHVVEVLSSPGPLFELLGHLPQLVVAFALQGFLERVDLVDATLVLLARLLSRLLIEGIQLLQGRAKKMALSKPAPTRALLFTCAVRAPGRFRVSASEAQRGAQGQRSNEARQRRPSIARSSCTSAGLCMQHVLRRYGRAVARGAPQGGRYKSCHILHPRSAATARLLGRKAQNAELTAHGWRAQKKLAWARDDLSNVA
mmetsp:Transcript_81807/g.212876  ORF Transcript_81807/g.212876 Transcript_81807/m.212876 type:complete len:230 (+) Transcript_81807:3370-4059(+)